MEKKNDIKLHESVTDFLSYCKTIKGLSPETILGYQNDLKLFFGYMKQLKKKNVTDRFIKNIELQDLHKFMTYLEDECNNSVVTRSRKISALKGYFEYLQNISKLITSNPAYGLQKPKLPKKKPITLNLQQSKDLLNVLDKSDVNHFRDKCILTLFLHCGLRLTELTDIKIEDIKGDRLTILGKGNKERYNYFDDNCISVINDYLKNRKCDKASDEDKEYLFLSNRQRHISKEAVYKIVKRHLGEAELDTTKYSPHKLRGTYATLMHNAGANIRQIQVALGHISIKTTEVYLNVEENELRNMANINPLNK